jgi:nuclear GTP-binding protein
MVAKKRKSKRTTLQNKYKIQKRTKEHHKRLNKSENGPGGRLKKKKFTAADQIPNAWPYKEDLLKQIQAAQEKMEAVKQRQKDKRAEEIAIRRGMKKAKKNGENDMDEANSDDEEEEVETRGKKNKNLLNLNSSKNLEMDQNHFSENDGGSYDNTHGGKDTALGKNSRRAFLKELRKTVDGSDVVLQVLDARDPLGTASTAVEEMVSSKSNKKLVYVLNKADLVPRDVLVDWLTYLRRSHPTIPFKCNTQQGQSRNLGRTKGKANTAGNENALQTNQAVGTEELIGLLKNYCRNGGDSSSKSVIVVGIVGFPNVGKSSLINSLMRSRAVGVSSTPGYTTKAQEVILDKNIRLMDTPGVVFADGDSASTTLRNCINVEELEDILTPIQAILERCPPGYLMQLYNIPAFKPTDSTGFLALVARSTGKLKKGGIPNTDAAARGILHDWNGGKIKYYCKAPQIAYSKSTTEEGASKIVSNFSNEMSLNDNGNGNLDAGALRVLDELQTMETNNNITSSYVSMDNVADSINPYQDDDDDVMSVASAKSKTSKKTTSTRSTRNSKMEQSDDEDDDEDDDEEKTVMPVKNTRKSNQATLKKKKKDGRRSGGSKEKYEFDEHF